MSETPETDAIYESARRYPSGLVDPQGPTSKALLEHARKLERERNEAIEARNAWREASLSQDYMQEIRAQLTALRSDMALILRHIDADEGDQIDEP